MESGRIVSAVVKVWVLAMIAGALYFLWSERARPPLASDLESQEEVKHTDVEVRVGTIQKMTLHSYVVGFGNVEAEPASANMPAAQARITVDWPAVVSEVDCIEGQHVTKGQALFISKSVPIVSPIDGTVVAVNVHTGEVALPTQTAVEIVDLDRLVVATGVPAWQAAAISSGRPAHVEIPADAGDVKFESKVARVDSAVDPKTNLVSVDISVPRGLAIRPGQFARVGIVGTEQPDCLAVPADAVVRDSLDRSFIGIVSDDQKQAVLKQVAVGLREGDWVQVTGDGLSAGQAIVVGGAYGLLFRTEISVGH